MTICKIPTIFWRMYLLLENFRWLSPILPVHLPGLIVSLKQAQGISFTAAFGQGHVHFLTWGHGRHHLGVEPKMVGFPNQQPWVFLLKMISTWGVKWGYHHLRKQPFKGLYMDVSKNRGKMDGEYFMENPLFFNGWFGGENVPLFLGNTHLSLSDVPGWLATPLA